MTPLDTSRSIESYAVSIYTILTNSVHFSSISLDSFNLFTSQNFSLTPNLQPKCSSVFECIFCFWYVSFSLIHHAFHVFLPNFLVCVENSGFFKIVGFFTKILGCFFVKMLLNHRPLHLIYIITMIHAF